MKKFLIVLLIIILLVGVLILLEQGTENGENGLVIEECFVGGCSGELCTNDPEAASTCELLAGMECIGIGGMSCGAAEGECRWVLDQESAECFMAVETEHGPEVRETRIGHLFDKAEEVLGGENGDSQEMTQAQREALVEEYIRENISTLSPEPEVLGGTFYVTEIEFAGEGGGVVEYEDGHIALVAEFQYEVSAEGEVEVALTGVEELVF